MSDPFNLALTFSLRWEGGDKYTNDPVDPGGETKYGISKKAYPDVDIKSLTLEEASMLYQRDYWDKTGCPLMGLPLAIAAFDSAVNCGVGRTRSWLADLDAHDESVARKMASLLMQKRIAYYADLVKRKPALNKYIKGWCNRVNDLSKYIDVVKT